jgi:hypothetical protein
MHLSVLVLNGIFIEIASLGMETQRGSREYNDFRRMERLGGNVYNQEPAPGIFLSISNPLKEKGICCSFMS